MDIIYYMYLPEYHSKGFQLLLELLLDSEVYEWIMFISKNPQNLYHVITKWKKLIWKDYIV